MFTSLRNRLTFSFIGLAIIPVVTISAILTLRSFSTLEQESLDSQSEIAQRVGAEIDRFVQERESELRLLSDVNDLAALEQREQRIVLNNLLANQQLYLELSLLDTDGQELFRLSRFGVVDEGDLVNRADNAEFLIPSTQGASYYSPIYFGEAAREPLITISLPVNDLVSSELRYVVVADFRFRTIWDFIAGLEFRDEETVYVIDTIGKIVAHSDPAVVFEETRIELPDEDGRAVGLSGEDVIFARENLQFGEQQLTVIAEQPTSVALQQANEGLAVAAIVTAIALMIAIVLGFLTVQRVIRPVERLAAVARTIQEGDLSVRAEVTTRDEIGALAESFNSMTNRLSGFIETLEERVTDRTRDLRVAADVSQQITTELDNEHLLQQVARLTASSFKFYATVVFLYDAKRKLLIPTTGANAQGELLETTTMEPIALDAEPSVVALAARQQEAIVLNDVATTPAFLPLPNLPNTRSEFVIPMARGGDLLGIFDIQSETKDRFSDEDAQVLKTLAEQVAIAIRNANLFTETQAAKAEAEEADRVKSQFLANMSHELRTPLNAILNFTEFVADGVLGPVNEKQEETLRRAITSGDHLLSLINDILDLTKIEIGRMDLFVEKVDMNDLLESMMATTKGLTKDRPNIQIHHRFEADLPVIDGDKRRIRQVLLNLISNAVKFTPSGEIHISAQREDDTVHLIVRDTGIGISPEDQAVIFDSFRQGQQGLTAGSGTGLGLPISKLLVESHGGRLWIDSAANVGTRCHVILPIKAPAEQKETETS